MPLPAATTRSPGGTLCEAPLYVLLKHPSRRRSDPWGFVLGRWVAARALGALGVGCAAGSPPGGRVDDKATLRKSRWIG